MFLYWFEHKHDKELCLCANTNPIELCLCLCAKSCCLALEILIWHTHLTLVRISSISFYFGFVILLNYSPLFPTLLFLSFPFRTQSIKYRDAMSKSRNEISANVTMLAPMNSPARPPNALMESMREYLRSTNKVKQGRALFTFYLTVF